MIDTTGTLDASQTGRLDAKLAGLERDKGAQLVVLMVPTTAPEDIASYANRVGNDWKLGRRDVGDGVILLVALKDRKMRIEVGKTLEGAIPDIAAWQIIDEALKPHFRQGDFAGGLNAAVDQLSARIRGEALPPVSQPHARTSSSDGALDWAGLAIMALVLLPVVSAFARALLGRGLGALTTGGLAGWMAFMVTASVGIAVGAALMALLFAFSARGLSSAVSRGRSGGWGGPVFLPNSGGGWSGGGSSDSGGFSSGGGGDFGGGGASGDW